MDHFKKLYRKDENIEKEAGMGQLKNYTKEGTIYKMVL